MKLTPLDIRKQEFSRRVRGVDEEEVKAFLQMIASQWDEVHDEHRRLEDKVRDLDAKLEHYKHVEEALQEALRTARENAKDALETARQKAEVIVQEAESSAAHIKRDADDDRRKMKRQVARLSQRRDEIISRLRAFLISEMEMLARYEGDDAVGFIKLMPAEERMLQEASDHARAPKQAKIEEPGEAPASDAPLPAWALFQGEEGSEATDDEAESPIEKAAITKAEPDLPQANADTAAPRDDDAEVTPTEFADTDVPVASVSDPERYGSAEEVESISDAKSEEDEAEPEPEPEAPEEAAAEPVVAENDSGELEGSHDAHEQEPPSAALSNGVVEESPEEPAGGVGGAEIGEVPESESDEQPIDAAVLEAGQVSKGDAPSSPKGADQRPTGDPGDPPGMSRWLSNHVFSAFKKSGQEPGDEPTRSPHSTQPGAKSRESPPDGEEYRQPVNQPVAEDDEESFTVSSEEVERIRRILKGLD